MDRRDANTTGLVRRLTEGDREAWLRLRTRLWPHEEGLAEGADELLAQLPSGEVAVFVYESPDGSLAGFAEAGLRSYAEGALEAPVAYLEGWYVIPEQRGRGVGRRLLVRVEHWARQRGLRELASDTWLENADSIAAHGALGFAEVERIVCFVKRLDGDR